MAEPGVATAPTAVEFKAVDIVFGSSPERALPLIDEQRPREEILERTGQILGVADASLAIGRGELCVLMGLSGSGKSTLLRAVNRLNHVARGQVLIADDAGLIDVGRCDGTTLRRLRTHRIGMVFQQFGLLPWRTVAENVGFGLEVRGVPKAERRRQVEEKLALVHLEAWADKAVHELSGGMQQRVGLARAFATDADILLMDEPFSALDPLIRVKLQDELVELQRRLDKTIIFVSHDLEEALKLGSTIAIMQGGRIVQAGPPETIVTRPATEYVREFVAHVNPLSVLTLGSALRPLTSFAGDGDRRTVDPRIGFKVTVDGEGRLATAVGTGFDLVPVETVEAIDPARVPCDQVLVADLGAPLRVAIEAIRMSGWPVLVVDPQGRLAGVVGIDELLESLRRPSAVPG